MRWVTARVRRPPRPIMIAPRGGLALIILDMINVFDFPGGEVLAPKARQIAERILAIRQHIERAGWPVVYVNDNFGEWHSERSRLVEAAIDAGSEGARLLEPDPADYFIIKPKFSGFYSSNLAVLLPKLGVSRLIVSGVATDMCVLFTAADAHMRDYALWVPSDLVAAEDDTRGQAALDIMAKSMGAEVAATTDLDVLSWIARLDRDDA